MAFIQRRLRLLIGWDRVLLQPKFYSDLTMDVFPGVDGGDIFSPLIGILWEEKCHDIKLLEFIWEMAISNYPRSLLGYGFHGVAFNLVCERFGNERPTNGLW